MAANFYIKRNDTKPPIQVTLADGDGAAVDLTGATVQFHMKSLDTGTVKVDAAASVTKAVAGEVQYNWSAADTDTIGRYAVEWEVTYSDSSVQTFPGDSTDFVHVVADIA